MATKTKKGKRSSTGKPLRPRRPKPTRRARVRLATSRRPKRAAAKPPTGTAARPDRGRSATAELGADSKFQQRRVVIRFNDGFDEKRERMILAKQYGSIVLRRVFAAGRSAALRLQARARRANPRYSLPDLRNYYFLYLQPGLEPAEVAIEQRKRSIVGFAYEDAPTKAANWQPSPQQKCGLSSRHFEGLCEGVDARFAWTILGGKGDGQSLVDVERGWTREHKRLPKNRIEHVAGKIDLGERFHGTAVLGIVCGKHIGGCEGIAPNVQWVGLVSVVPDGQRVPGDDPDTAARENIYEAVAIAINELRQRYKPSSKNGRGVLLLEHQTEAGLPLETYELMHNLIWTATNAANADKITVIEPAGNQPAAGVNIDAFLPQDSGAIVVGSAYKDAITPTAGQKYHQRFSTSNFGNRVNCYAWGQCVVTPAWRSGNPPVPGVLDECDDQFGQTSAAAAIIAGVALIVQGIVAKRGHLALTASQLRAILANPALGTPCTPGDQIGVMPDLSKIAPTL
jgi:hypothetical protein